MATSRDTWLTARSLGWNVLLLPFVGAPCSYITWKFHSAISWATRWVFHRAEHMFEEIFSVSVCPGKTLKDVALPPFQVPAKWRETKCLHALQQQLGVPHSEDVLALLVNVHIRGGAKDLAIHVRGLTMRVAVVAELIRILRKRWASWLRREWVEF